MIVKMIIETLMGAKVIRFIKYIIHHSPSFFLALTNNAWWCQTIPKTGLVTGRSDTIIHVGHEKFDLLHKCDQLQHLTFFM
mmetsp:Transcript_21653/g.27927  ORF Transcript_21653/g.27927 Transcript_21653/m.27927 type:complete len:81 (-) Transcript_21653:242-484(-)